jgi:hypothetical protein
MKPASGRPASKLQFSCGGLHSQPGGQPHVQSVGNGTATVNAGLVIRVGQMTRLVALEVVLWSSSFRVAVKVRELMSTSVAVVGTIEVSVSV